MKRNIQDNPDSISSLIDISDIKNSLFSNSEEKLSEIQIPHFQSQVETPLSTKGNVKSYCRIRPNNTVFSCLNKFTLENNNTKLKVDFSQESDKGNTSKQNLIEYNFTEIFGINTSNQEIYLKVCKANIEQLFTKHRNALIFVYGITNSGKTYTVNGILQFALKDLFKEFEKLKKNNNLWELNCTYIEIYNEEIFDLLSKDRKKLKICMSKTNKIIPQGATIKNIKKEEDYKDALKFGEINRSKCETKANPYSSRSHSIFRVELSFKENSPYNKTYIEPVSLCIVDLAGAERVSNSGVTGNGLKEAGNINTSLLCLKRCFYAMEANSKVNCSEKKVIVPVRESKLTLLFKEYFGAHQNISIICTINPHKNEMNDIKSVLTFGSRAMRIKTMKSWIKTNYSNSRNVSPSKNNSRFNTPFKDSKKYRMLTNKKYLEKNNNSKEKDYKCKEDYNSNDSFNKNKNNNNFLNSYDKIININLVKNKNEENISDINTKRIILKNKNSNINNDMNINYEERIKCTTNPFKLIVSDISSIQFNACKEKENIEQRMKMKQEEMKEKMSKKGENFKHTFANFIKKLYYDNYNRNIEIYENQCRNIDLSELEILLKNNNKIYKFVNPFIKNYEEDKKIFSKNLKECGGDNSFTINSGLGESRNNLKNNDQSEDSLRLKYEYSNDHEHDQTLVNDYLDRSNIQYETSKFKAYFGIGESIIKKMEQEKKIKNKEIVQKFESLNNEDIEMANNYNFNDDEIFNNELNFKKKGKNIKEKEIFPQNQENYENKEKNSLNKGDEDINENKNKDINLIDNKKEEQINDDNEDKEKSKNKSKNENNAKNKKKKKKKYLQEKKEKENDEINNEEDENNNDDENNEKDKSKNKRKRKGKSKKNKKRNESKKNQITNNNSNISIDDEDEISILANKKSRKNNKIKKSKKKKLETDNETDDSLSDDNINLKLPKTKKRKTKKK